MKCRKNSETKNTRIGKTNKEKLILLLTCATCESKKSRILKNQVPKGLLSNLGIRTLLSKIAQLGDIVF